MKIDNYYAGLAREKLSKVESELIGAQDYILLAGAPEWYKRNIRRILSAIRNRQDEILTLMDYQSAQQKIAADESISAE